MDSAARSWWGHEYDGRRRITYLRLRSGSYHSQNEMCTRRARDPGSASIHGLGLARVVEASALSIHVPFQSECALSKREGLLP